MDQDEIAATRRLRLSPSRAPSFNGNEEFIMEVDVVVHAKARIIHVLVVVDTERVKETYGSNPDRLAPTSVSPKHLFMIGAGSRSDIGELKLKARIGDVVSMTGVSIYNNADDAVIVYGVHPVARGAVFDRFNPNYVTRMAGVQPDPDSPNQNGLPAMEKEVNFLSFESKIAAHGVERLDLAFALYTLSDDGQNQEIFGYYRCDLAIAVERPRSTDDE
ncbi:inclusion body family protein [Burkholderia ubonensis]|nr:inclusion body family protein [Burkholderia ubonensis]